jgi:hypothetical protein
MSFPNRVRVLKTSALVGFVAWGFGFPFIGIMEYFRSNVSSDPLPKMILVVVPLLLGSACFVTTLIFCVLYNGLRKFIGGQNA